MWLSFVRIVTEESEYQFPHCYLVFGALQERNRARVNSCQKSWDGSTVQTSATCVYCTKKKTPNERQITISSQGGCLVVQKSDQIVFWEEELFLFQGKEPFFAQRSLAVLGLHFRAEQVHGSRLLQKKRRQVNVLLSHRDACFWGKPLFTSILDTTRLQAWP